MPLDNAFANLAFAHLAFANLAFCTLTYTHDASLLQSQVTRVTKPSTSMQSILFTQPLVRQRST